MYIFGDVWRWSTTKKAKKKNKEEKEDIIKKSRLTMFKFINLLLFYFFTITGRITFGSITVFAIYVPYLTLIAAGAAAGGGAAAVAVAACGVVVMYILMVPISSTHSQSQIIL